MNIPKAAPVMFQELMEKCWKQNPKERPDFYEILSLLNVSNLSLDQSEIEKQSKQLVIQEYQTGQLGTGQSKEEYNLSN